MVADMQRQTTKRLFDAACVLFAASAISATFVAPAAAQVPEPGTLIEEVTGQVGDAASDLGDGVAGIVEDTTEAVGDVVGGQAGQVADDLGEAVGSTVRDVTHEADDAVTGTGSTVGNAVTDVVGDPDEPDQGTNGGAPSVSDPTTRGREDPVGSGRTLDGRPSVPGRLASVGADPGSTATTVSAPEDVATVGSSTSSDAGDDLLDAFAGITFPLALVALVAAFLAVHGRVDGTDPKLSIAARDAEDQMLSFR